MTGLWLRNATIWQDIGPTTAPPPPPPTGTLPAAGPHALWSPTKSPTRVPINWDTAIIDTTHKMTSAMIDANTHVPYVAIADSDCQTYWTDGSTAGRLTVTSVNYGAGTYTIVCPTGAQPSTAGGDYSMQVVQPDGYLIDLYPGTRAGTPGRITWSGNNGTITVDGYLKQSLPISQATGWAVGINGGVPSTSSYLKQGFAACGATSNAGSITAEDKELGYIAHALALVFNNNGLANGPVGPATRQDGTNSYPTGNVYYHQGQLLAIVPPAKGGPSRPGGWSSWDHAIVDAFMNYGGYVMDRTGGFVIRAQAVKEPGVTATLSSSDFNNVMTLAAGSVGKFLFDNLRIVTKAKTTLAYHS